jgi:hypothetical protein
MSNHPLEKASWIAGIVSAVVAIIVWLAPSQSTSNDAKQSVHQSSDTPVGKDRPSSNAASQSIPPTAGTQTNLSALLSTADQLYGVDNRNLAYSKIFEKALAQNNYAFATKVVDKAYGVDIRNKLYMKAIDQAISQNRVDLAEPLIEKLYGVGPRNAAINKVLDAKAKAPDPASSGASAASRQ